MSQLAISEKYDITQNVSLETCALTLKNLKGQLYSREYVDEVVGDVSNSRKLNSFIRPKIEA